MPQHEKRLKTEHINEYTNLIVLQTVSSDEGETSGKAID